MDTKISASVNTITYTQCVVCGANVIFDPTCRHPESTRYWSLYKDGDIRPYCSAARGLKDYEEKANS